jgi:hypothetical protein
MGVEQNEVTMHVFLIAALALATLSQTPTKTLRQVLEQYRVDAGPGAARDLDQPLGNFLVDDTDEFFFVVYFPDVDNLHFGLFDKRLKVWKQTSTPRDIMMGSLSGIAHSQTRFYIDTHLNPSAGGLVVVDKDLKTVSVLFGWLLKILPDESIIYHRGEVHFAPTHPAELWIYDRNGRDRRLYPNPPYQPVRQTYIQTVKRIYDEKGETWFRENNHHGDPTAFDSAIDNVVVNAVTESVAFISTFGGDGQVPTPAQDVLVVCRNIESLAASCTEQLVADINSAHPAWSNQQIVEDAIH